jgi:hypothetical protein
MTHRLVPLLLLMVVLQAASCASTQLETGPEHPASSQAPSSPLPRPTQAFDQGFDPGATGTAPSAASPEHSHSHAHRATQDGQSSGSNPAHEHEPAASDSANRGIQGGATNTDKAAEEKRWTCPMHPEVIKSEAGRCPKCGMNLVPIAPKSGQ